MISIKLIIYLSIGTAVMLVPILMQSRWHGMILWKSIVLTLFLTVMGTVGTYILFFIENQWIGGTSFYGAVFFVPISFVLVSKLLREPYEHVMDLCAPAECAMLVVMKIQCSLSGCCGGRILFASTRFPSQMVELVNALIIMMILFAMARKKPRRGDLYPMYMIIYGCSRFVLNLLREDQSAFLMGLPAGNFWSVVAVVWGTVWMMTCSKQIQK